MRAIISPQRRTCAKGAKGQLGRDSQANMRKEPLMPSPLGDCEGGFAPMRVGFEEILWGSIAERSRLG